MKISTDVRTGIAAALVTAAPELEDRGGSRPRRFVPNGETRLLVMYDLPRSRFHRRHFTVKWAQLHQPALTDGLVRLGPETLLEETDVSKKHHGFSARPALLPVLDALDRLLDEEPSRRVPDPWVGVETETLPEEQREGHYLDKVEDLYVRPLSRAPRRFRQSSQSEYLLWPVDGLKRVSNAYLFGPYPRPAWYGLAGQLGRFQVNLEPQHRDYLPLRDQVLREKAMLA